MGHDFSVVACVAAWGALGYCATSDLLYRRIPNWVVALIALTFLVHGLGRDLSLSQWGLHLAVAGGAFVICALCFMAGWLGGGDVKLATTVLLWAGPLVAPVILVVTGLSGILVALTGLVIQRLEPTTSGTLPGPLAVWSARRGVPYGIGLSLGGALAVLSQF